MCAAPATGGGCVLGEENRMVFHRCLLAVIFRESGRNSGIYELKGMFFDSFETFGGDVIPVFLGQMKFGPEFGFFKGI